MPRDAVHVVMVAYGKADELDDALGALEGSVPVTVVDNSSSELVAAVAVRHGARYVDSGENVGFARGVNAGLRRLDIDPPQAVLLLNPDALIRPHEISRLLEFMFEASNERVAAVAPALADTSGGSTRVVWPFPSPWRAWLEAVGLGRVPWPGRRFVIGAVLLLRWEAVSEIGLFDERFFLYCEEIDWQRRAVSRGWTSALCAQVEARHRGAGSSDDSYRREALFHAGHETYMRKWYGASGWFAYRCAAALGATLRVLLLRGERRAAARQRIRLYLRGPRRAAGLATK